MINSRTGLILRKTGDRGRFQTGALRTVKIAHGGLIPFFIYNMTQSMKQNDGNREKIPAADRANGNREQSAINSSLFLFYVMISASDHSFLRAAGRHDEPPREFPARFQRFF